MSLPTAALAVVLKTIALSLVLKTIAFANLTRAARMQFGALNQAQAKRGKSVELNYGKIEGFEAKEIQSKAGVPDEETCMKEAQLSPAPEADLEIVKDLFPPLMDIKMGSGFDVNDQRKTYNDLKIQAVWKTIDNNIMLKKYIEEVNALNKELGQYYSAELPRHEVHKHAKELGIVGENEYLLWKRSRSAENLKRDLCIRGKLDTSLLKNIFGIGWYFYDASEKADQYVKPTSNQFESMFDTMGHADACLKKIQESSEHQDQFFFMGLYRAYLGSYYEVGFEKVGGLAHYNSLPLEKREHVWHYRSPTSGEEKTIEEVGNSIDRSWYFADSQNWTSARVMSKTFEPGFSKDWQHHPFPTRYNEYVLRNTTPWALQYIVAYKRGLKEDSNTSECRTSGAMSQIKTNWRRIAIVMSALQWLGCAPLV